MQIISMHITGVIDEYLSVYIIEHLDPQVAIYGSRYMCIISLYIILHQFWLPVEIYVSEKEYSWSDKSHSIFQQAHFNLTVV